MNMSPGYMREKLQVAQGNTKAMLKAALIIAKASFTAAKLGRTMLHLAWEGNEHFVDGFLAAFAWVVVIEVFSWLKWIINAWLLVVFFLWLAGML
jgi:hypothetical protein